MLMNDDFVPAQGYECLNACICNYLSMWGYPLDCSCLFFGGDGFDIKFCKDEGIRLNANVYKSNFEFMRKNNIRFFEMHEDNQERIAQKLIDMIEGEKYICVKIASSSLKYNRVYMQNESLHYINVIGYDSGAKKLLVVDGFVPTLIPSTFYGWVDFDDIINGWYKSQFDYIELEIPKVMDFSNLKEKFKVDVVSQLKRYVDGKGLDDTNVWGCNACLSMFQELLKCEDKVLHDLTLEANYQIRICGLFGSRYYLRNAVNILLDNQKFAEAIEKNIAKWNSVSMALIKASIIKKKEILKIIYNDVEVLIVEEKKLYLEIIDQLMCSN